MADEPDPSLPWKPIAYRPAWTPRKPHQDAPRPPAVSGAGPRASGPEASPIERLLAERVALCYLDVHDWELRHNGAAMEARGGLLWEQHAHYQRMRDRAQRRYLLALKSLAQVKRLALPAVQVNIGANQVNVAGSPESPEGAGYELAGPDPSPVKAMLARSAALAWAFVRRDEAQSAAMVHEPRAIARQVEDRDRRLDRAHRRHLAALRTLAVVRKLAVPALQINVGRNQVNVAGALAAGAAADDPAC